MRKAVYTFWIFLNIVTYCDAAPKNTDDPLLTNMLDMLFQDWGGTIRVFPAIPSSW